MNKTMINNRYYIKNKNKIEFVKKLADARLRGHEVIKIKTEKQVRSSADRDHYSYQRYKHHETSVEFLYVALLEITYQ